MCRVTVLFVLMVMSSMATHSAQAQVAGASVPTVAEGTRVRVAAAHRRDVITGVVVLHSSDSLIVQSDKDSGIVALPTGQLSRLEVSRGRRTQKLRGAGIGFITGAGIGALFGLATYEKPSCSGEGWVCLDFGPQFDAAVGATLLGAIGALAGAMMGSRERELWRPAPADSRRDARLGVAPARGGVALTASLSF